MRAHRIRIVPTAVQERAFHGFARVVRWTWNTVLRAHNAQVAEWDAAGRAGPAPTIASLQPRFNEGRPAFAAWTSAAGHRDCWSEPFVDLQRAFKAKREGRAAHPRPKRFDATPSFYVANDKFSLDDRRIRLPKVGWVRVAESLRFDGTPRCARVTRDGAGRWFASIQVAGVALPPAPAPLVEAVGIDVGIANTITLSTGQVYAAPRTTNAEKARMRRLQRSVSRKFEARKARRAAVRKAGGDLRAVVASHREGAARQKVARLHARIADRRRDWQHKTTTAIARQAGQLGLETLSIKGMIRSKRKGQARALSDIGLAEIHRQLRYKAEGRVHDWPRSYPSSQLCSACGVRRKMPLRSRIYRCACGLTLCRDANAARNLDPRRLGGVRGAGGSQYAEVQAATGLPVVQPVSAESVKRRGGSLGLT